MCRQVRELRAIMRAAGDELASDLQLDERKVVSFESGSHSSRTFLIEMAMLRNRNCCGDGFQQPQLGNGRRGVDLDDESLESPLIGQLPAQRCDRHRIPKTRDRQLDAISTAPVWAWKPRQSSARRAITRSESAIPSLERSAAITAAAPLSASVRAFHLGLVHQFGSPRADSLGGLDGGSRRLLRLDQRRTASRKVPAVNGVGSNAAWRGRASRRAPGTAPTIGEVRGPSTRTLPS